MRIFEVGFVKSAVEIQHFRFGDAVSGRIMEWYSRFRRKANHIEVGIKISKNPLDYNFLGLIID